MLRSHIDVVVPTGPVRACATVALPPTAADTTPSTYAANALPACSLSFYALTLMSAHLYTLLCDLKVISTGLVNYLVLDRRINRHAVVSLFVLFLGICIGQWSTMRATAGSISAMAATAHFKAAGFLLMVLISLISATASNYTEWVMNFSQYRHESLNLQNMRLYSIGMALNAAYYLQSGGRLEGFFSDVMAPHWAIVMVLALMGLITVRNQAAALIVYML